MIKKYKKGDEVIVKVGKDKGKIGKIARVFNSIDKVIISGKIIWSLIPIVILPWPSNDFFE